MTSIEGLPDRDFVERHHDIELQFGTAAHTAAVKSAEEALKAVLLVNGGSCVAMLAFLGTLVSRDALTPSQLGEAIRPMLWFGAGLFSAVGASIAAYFVGLCRGNASHSRKRSYIEPFLSDTQDTTRFHFWTSVSTAVAIACVFLSLILFGAGLVSAARGFSQLTPVSKPAASSQLK
jgi:hypothetical protein